MKTVITTKKQILGVLNQIKKIVEKNKPQYEVLIIPKKLYKKIHKIAPSSLDNPSFIK